MSNTKLPLGTFKLSLEIVRKSYLINKPDLDNKVSGFVSFIGGFFNFGSYCYCPFMETGRNYIKF